MKMDSRQERHLHLSFESHSVVEHVVIRLDLEELHSADLAAEVIINESHHFDRILMRTEKENKTIPRKFYRNFTD